MESRLHVTFGVLNPLASEFSHSLRFNTGAAMFKVVNFTKKKNRYVICLSTIDINVDEYEVGKINGN